MPPVEAKPGSPFGGDEIRDVDAVAKLKLKAELAGYEVEGLGSQLKAAYRQLAAAPRPPRSDTNVTSSSFSKSRSQKKGR